MNFLGLQSGLLAWSWLWLLFWSENVTAKTLNDAVEVIQATLERSRGYPLTAKMISQRTGVPYHNLRRILRNEFDLDVQVTTGGKKLFMLRSE